MVEIAVLVGGIIVQDTVVGGGWWVAGEDGNKYFSKYSFNHFRERKQWIYPIFGMLKVASSAKIVMPAFLL